MIANLRAIVTAAMVASVAVGVPAAAGQESLSAARDLYTHAAYEDALVLLDRLRAAERPAAESRLVEEYRAFCLLALGRSVDAERTIEAIVEAEPSCRPSSTDVSPRLLTAFAEVRKRVLPIIAQSRYTAAKGAFDRKEWAAAEAGFQQVLDVLIDPDLHAAVSQPPLADMRTLAAGFRDLSQKAATPPPPPPPPVEPPRAPEPVVPSPPRIYSLGDAGVVPPVTIQQTLPPFPAQSTLGPSQGAVEVVINETGAVESAVMRAPLGAVYDRQVLSAVRSWRYKPATLNGVPVKVRKLVQISVKR